ncbi:MAG: phospho-N-acetylmuramoyl-pentapeptide-transferase, partial [Suilimivivens sp.]
MGSISIIVPIMISFAISVVAGPVLIPLLKMLKAAQTVRDDGPKTHLKKSGTPTMGGILILISVTVTALLYVNEYRKVVPVLFLTLGFGLI